MDSTNVLDDSHTVNLATCTDERISAESEEENIGYKVVRCKRRRHVSTEGNIHPMVTRLKDGIVKPKVFIVTKESDSVEAALRAEAGYDRGIYGFI